MKMEQCPETSVFKLQTPGNYPKESIQHFQSCSSPNSGIDDTTIVMVIMRMVVVMVTPACVDSANLKGDARY
jgi:hypothetical protein